MPGPGPGAVDPDLQKKVDLWFMLSIVSLFCGCGLLGLIPIFMSNAAKEAIQRGDYALAQDKIGTAKLLVILGFSGAALIGLIYFVIFLVVGVASF